MMLARAICLKLHNNGIEQMLYVNRQRRVFAYPERKKPEIQSICSYPEQG